MSVGKKIKKYYFIPFYFQIWDKMTEKRARKPIVGGKDFEAGKLEMHSLVPNKNQNVNDKIEEKLHTERNFFL